MNIEEKINSLIQYRDRYGTESKISDMRKLLSEILSDYSADDFEYIMQTARNITDAIYGKKIYIRGLIEFTNYCKNDCFYCGIRSSNFGIERYRLSMEEVLKCCERGYKLGLRSFVIQGGEDMSYKDDFYIEVIQKLKQYYPDSAVALSIGERSYDSYKSYKDAGADRYLLRHETASREHYGKLHPPKMSYDNRMECLRMLKSLGYQTGCGIMVGSPFQTRDNLVEDIIFMHSFKPEMIGIGPFIPCASTPFEQYSKGSVDDTLMVIALMRILCPNVLMPSTTALGSADKQGRIRGLMAGCNVVMVNISPALQRVKYNLYNNKAVTAFDAIEDVAHIKQEISEAGFEFCNQRGDYIR